MSCPILCNPMDCSTPGFPVLHWLPGFAQTHVHWISDAIQPFHVLSLLLLVRTYRLWKVKVKVAQSCPTLCNPMDWILHARLLECVAFPFCRGPSQPKDWTQVSHIAGGCFTSWAIREAQSAKWCPLKSTHYTCFEHLPCPRTWVRHRHQVLECK